MPFSLHSHPDLLLKDHLEQVAITGMSRFRANGIYPEYEALLMVILSFHDIGKGSRFFQEYLLNSAPRSNHTKHSEFSALWACYYCLRELQAEPLDAIMVYVCVNSHHGNLGNLSELLCPDLSIKELLSINEQTDYDELNAILSSLGLIATLSSPGFQELLDFFDKTSLSTLYRRNLRMITKDSWVLLNYLFSILIWADKYSAVFQVQNTAQISNIWQTEFLDNYKKRFVATENTINVIRNQAYEELTFGISPSVHAYSINMPTGSGKTISSLKVALEIRKSLPHLQRIIYSLPFTSVIDQNFKVFGDILKNSSINVSSDVLLAHHHLADFTYQGKDEYSQNESEYLVETWDSELVVTTFVQILASCLSIKNNSLKRFHRLANAVIILDEVQNIPHYYWLLLQHTLKTLCRNLHSVVLLVTATLPMIFDPNDPEQLELAFRKNEWFSALNRIELHRNLLNQPMDVKELADVIARDYHQNPHLKRLIIVNTVQCSIDIYNLLKDLLPEAVFVYLSANVIPKHRLERIEQIKKAHPEGIIIVSTQVVEAGVDIDVDTVYRDLAPLDSIIQASGRCNRNETKECSRVILFQLVKNQKPYWKYVYDETLVQSTLKALGADDTPIGESSLHDISSAYYANLGDVCTTDVSRRIINSLSRLDLLSALGYHSHENPDAFNLIDSHPTKTMFVDVDNDSSELVFRYEEVKKQKDDNNFEQRAMQKALLRQMGAYMINVSKRYVMSEDAITFIERDSLSLSYDIETGFKRKDQQSDYIF